MALGVLQSDSNEGATGTTGQNKKKKEVVADQADGEQLAVEENISQTRESIDADSLSAKDNDVAVDVGTLKEKDYEIAADAGESETIKEKEKAERNREDAEKLTIIDYQIDEVENATKDQDDTSTYDNDKFPPNDFENNENLVKEDFEVKQSEAEEGNEDIEKQEKDDIKEEDGLNTKEEQDNIEEVGFAVQALASFGIGLGLTVHGSALVFPAVAVPRLKQVNSCENLRNYISSALSRVFVFKDISHIRSI